MFKSFLISLIVLGSLAAQTFSGKINPFPGPLSVKEIRDTIKILAVIADFQEDKDGSTFGNGKFGSIYSSDYGIKIIDPLPHDAQYFENHLNFIKNYFGKTSGGKQNIVYTVLPQVITVTKTMRNYSPPPKSDDLTPVADFAKEVWKKADSVYSTFDFSSYDLFMIFHAGVGRDVTLPGSLGNERDLPSVYFGPTALEKIYPGFQGFPVQSNSFNIMNSAIIPETESREISGIGGSALLELSINGLLAATTASYLQLPDLFDTETGLSAIGRFGLMDGQSIFAYNGLFPPEPSAWEKIFLGWFTPVEASFDKNQYSIVPSLIAGLSDTTILKVNLSSTEYYLIENRQRDVNGDGAVLTYISNGQVKTVSYPKDTTGFRSYEVDSLEGVVTNIDEPDWALPGNGIVIWHIDENVINEKIAENKINTDMNRRGVDVEEADGVQDIGVQFQTVFGDIVIGEGEERDFWFAGNTADLYQNRFSSDTRPNTLTNLGAKSLITISGFSGISNRMSFNITFGDSIIKPISNFNIAALQGGSLHFTSAPAAPYIFTAGGQLHLFDESGNEIQSSPDQTFISSGLKPLAFTSGDNLIVAGPDNASLNVLVRSGNTGNFFRTATSSLMTSSPVLLNSGEVMVGAADGKIYRFNLSFQPYSAAVDSIVFPGVDFIRLVAASEDFYSVVGQSGNTYFYLDKAGSRTELDFMPDELLLTKNISGQYVSALVGDHKLCFIENGKVVSIVQKENTGLTGAAFVDLKQDGNNYLVYNDGSIKAVNTKGVLADNFPFKDPQGIGFINFILSADFEGDKAAEIIAFTSDGRIFSIDGRTGKTTNGFPISAGTIINTYPIIYSTADNTRLTVLDGLKNLYTWSISSIPGKLYWSEELGSSTNTSFAPAAEKSNIVNEFFPPDRVYNYPNPVYEGKTFIRYYVAENSAINIKIFDLAGSLVKEFNSEAAGGSDNETSWDITGVQSGIYLARVEATSGSKTESNIIKIAVIR